MCYVLLDVKEIKVFSVIWLVRFTIFRVVLGSFGI